MRHKILVVDDEQDVRDLTRDIVANAGHEVITAADGHQGLKAFFSLRPELVVTDIVMPGMDGWTLLGRVREDTRRILQDNWRVVEELATSFESVYTNPPQADCLTAAQIRTVWERYDSHDEQSISQICGALLRIAHEAAAGGDDHEWAALPRVPPGGAPGLVQARLQVHEAPLRENPRGSGWRTGGGVGIGSGHG